MVRFKATYVQKMSPIRMIKHTLTISYTFGFSSSLVGVAVVIVDSLDWCAYIVIDCKNEGANIRYK